MNPTQPYKIKTKTKKTKLEKVLKACPLEFRYAKKKRKATLRFIKLSSGTCNGNQITAYL